MMRLRNAPFDFILLETFVRLPTLSPRHPLVLTFHKIFTNETDFHVLLCGGSCLSDLAIYLYSQVYARLSAVWVGSLDDSEGACYLSIVSSQVPIAH